MHCCDVENIVGALELDLVIRVFNCLEGVFGKLKSYT